jgi:heme-degrading monooxygenase HmoA
MFIAMNRFRVAKGSEAAFENVWMSRDSHLEKVPGFVEFHLLKGPEGEDHTLYASHTVWESRAVFEAWTKSEAFRTAQVGQGTTSRCIWIIRSLRGSRFVRPSSAAGERDAYLLSSVREL